jgi:hypothetical protein
MSVSRFLFRLAAVAALFAMPACTFLPQLPTASPIASACASDAFPKFENQLETKHFILRWTNSSPRKGDNICDPAIVRETASYLETAWEKYAALFGRTPFVSPVSGKVEVVFHEMNNLGLADPPEAPIQFNARAWTKQPGIRQPTSAHELFHKLQYAYGYRTRWTPEAPCHWFTEGTAVWSEVFVWGRVSWSAKVEGLFKDKNLDLYSSDDMAAPFWIFFVSGNRGVPCNELMVRLFERCEQTGDIRNSLDEVIRSAYGPPEAFYSLFAKERRNGFWEQGASAEGNSYSCIRGPDGCDIVQQLKGRKSGGS